MYALAARELYQAKTLDAKIQILRDFQTQKLAGKQPQYSEFESSFFDLKYSSQMTKQKPLIKYILTKIYQANSTGISIDPEQMTIEHLAPESPAKGNALTPEQVASIGNLILVSQPLNNKLDNKGFAEKVQILKNANVWVDPVVLQAKNWTAVEIENRTKLLANNAYNTVWSL
jgi:hypothetical protein